MEQTPKTGFNPSNSPSPELDFAIVLARVIEAVKQDPAELRNAVYDLARVKLHQQAWQSSPPVDILEMRRLSTALETAIDRVEAISSKQDQLRALKSLHRLIGDLNGDGNQADVDTSYALVGARDDINLTGAPILGIELNPQPTTRTSRFRYLTSWITFFPRTLVPALAFSVIAVLVLTFVLLKINGAASWLFMNGGTRASLDNANPLKNGMIREVELTPAPLPELKRTPDIPQPEAYGIYALNDGRLYELEPLPGRVPDQRVFMSAMITKPSQTTVPDGRISFVAYRRDFATAAPSRAAVRVVARVARAMSITAGKVDNRTVDDAWAIRNIDFELKVSPVDSKPEMLLLRGDSPDFVLTPGRYGLVLNNIAYDFTVAGQVTDMAHCLERTIAANGIFYSECRAP